MKNLEKSWKKRFFSYWEYLMDVIRLVWNWKRSEHINILKEKNYAVKISFSRPRFFIFVKFGHFWKWKQGFQMRNFLFNTTKLYGLNHTINKMKNRKIFRVSKMETHFEANILQHSIITILFYIRSFCYWNSSFGNPKKCPEKCPKMAENWRPFWKIFMVTRCFSYFAIMTDMLTFLFFHFFTFFYWKVVEVFENGHF